MSANNLEPRRQGPQLGISRRCFLYQLIRQQKPIGNRAVRDRVSGSGRRGVCVYLRL